ncbi:MAG: 6-phosphogluconolactonase [Spirochaetales bacterium]|nr:6-phosphogluconolactonase [Spirochaetales bacterium]
MRITICDDKKELGRQAAKRGAEEIRIAIAKHGYANVAFVTGLSQVETLRNLRTENVDWSKVNIFFLDEYIGIPKDHKASSLNFLRENFLSFIDEPCSIHPIDREEENIEATLAELNSIMATHPLDVSFICIGENGHLALNDPPADFDTKDPYIVVELEKRSRRQQVGEGWFKTFDDVPEKAITMSIREIISSNHIICSCPDQRKAKAVAMSIFDDLNTANPCAMLRYGKDVDLFLDRQSSCLVLRDGRC